MANHRSFSEYIANQFYNKMFYELKNFVFENKQKLELRSYSVQNIDTVALSDINVKSVGIDDKEGSQISFDVAIEAEIEIQEYSNRKGVKSDLCTQWFLLRCSGDISVGVKSFKIEHIEIYSQRQHQKNPLSDALVPIIYADSLEQEAEKFLRKYYPEALAKPMPVDPYILADRMGLTVLEHGITEDASVFGALFFAATDAELYDLKTSTPVNVPIKGGTVVVDPLNFLLRNLGSYNNTIVHECVHWDLHKKSFELERLYNGEAQQIRCKVVGGFKEGYSRSATDYMEWQATSLAPRIQMPLGSFKVKAYEIIRGYERLLGDIDLIHILQPVIRDLAKFFGVSVSAAKIRMIDAGFEEAMGAFIYLDGKYVPPHRFKKGAIKKNQTYSIGVEDAALVSFGNSRLREQFERGCYVYVDSHVCLNSPKYVTNDRDGNLQMTDYGRLHIDECCIAFDLQVRTESKKREGFYTECVLFRDADSKLEFNVSFTPEINENVQAQADAIYEHMVDVRRVKSELASMGFKDSLQHLMDWAGVTSQQLVADARMDTRMLQRMRNNDGYPKKIEDVVAVCIGMSLPPELSECLIEKSGFAFRFADNEAHLYYQFFIKNMFNQPLSKCNEILEARGLPTIGIEY